MAKGGTVLGRTADPAMKRPDSQRIERIVRVTLGVLLLWAAVSKVANPTGFLASVYAYQLSLGHGFLKFVAVVVPWIELLSGLMLVANHRPLGALVCATTLMVVFLAVTGQAWVRGLKISCGCFDLALLGFGNGATAATAFLESVGFAFFRNLLLFSAFLWLLRYRAGLLSLAESLSRSSPLKQPAGV